MSLLATPCTDYLFQCRCSLDEHPIDVAHHCRDFDHVSKGECGGIWMTHPTDETLVLIVRYPVAAAEFHGIAQPTEPIVADRLSPMHRFTLDMERYYLDKIRSPDA